MLTNFTRISLVFCKHVKGFIFQVNGYPFAKQILFTKVTVIKCNNQGKNRNNLPVMPNKTAII